MSNHYALCLKLIEGYVSVTSQQKWEMSGTS